ncbi:MAG TPA: anion permease [Bacteroidales bacterium]
MAQNSESDQKKKPGMLLFKWVITIAVGLTIWFIPVPEGVSIVAWHLFAIFVATVVGIIASPIPLGAIALLAIILIVLTRTLNISEALSGFSNDVIWLIVTAFFISRGFIKTGLGARVAYFFISLLGKNSLGLAYGFIATDLVLSPAIPSNTARGGGIIYPIIHSTAKTYNSDPGNNSSRKIGAFLIFASFHGLNITSAMFLTAMAANPLAVELASGLGVQITWGIWALAALVPGLLSLILIPLFIYFIYPPEIKYTPNAAIMAKENLNKMGKMTIHEWILSFTFLLLLFLWIFGPIVKIQTTAAALTGLGLLLVTKVLTWDDILKESGAWTTLIWYASLVMMATYLSKLGLVPWFAENVKNMVSGSNWVSAFIILSLIYFYSHYFLASNTAHVSSMYVPFLTVSIIVGTPPVLAALVLGFFSSLFSSMTHYGTGAAPVFFGSDYIDMKTWWKFGFYISIITIVIWLGVGGIWWKIIGLW